MQTTLRVHRYRKDKRQEDVARAIDVRLATINAIENGRSIPSLVVAMRLAEYFNITVNDLFMLEETDRKQKPDETLAPPIDKPNDLG